MEFGNFGICIVNTCFSHLVGLNLNLFHYKLLLSAPTTFNWQPSLVSKHNIKTKSDEYSRGVACNVFNYDAMQLNKRWNDIGNYWILLKFLKPNALQYSFLVVSLSLQNENFRWLFLLGNWGVIAVSTFTDERQIRFDYDGPKQCNITDEYSYSRVTLNLRELVSQRMRKESER